MPHASILLIDDEDDIRLLLSRILKLEGYDVVGAPDGRTGLKEALKGEYEVCICDVRLPDANGLELAAEVKRRMPSMEVIQLTANGSIADGVAAVKAGAFDYLTKGDDNSRLLPLVERAAEKAQAQFRLQRIDELDAQRYGFDQIIGTSPAIVTSKRLASQVAVTDATVLVTGPTGTGKEVFANAIHYASARKRRPLLAVNCAAFSRELLESELFGHVAGAFTGASKTKKGLFEEADGGTLFLDELGEMDLGLQARLLRVLENGTFMKVGSATEQRVDVRIIAATNRDLVGEAEAGRFRLDLYYRLSTFVISLPSLSERPEDIRPLAEYFLAKLAPTVNPGVRGMDRDFELGLLRREWRGNVRELRNFIERALILAQGERLGRKDLPAGVAAGAETSPVAVVGDQGSEIPAVTSLAQLEREHIARVMSAVQGNKSRAAELLGIGLSTLYRKLEANA